MSLITLLEAAKFLELQEQNQAALDAALSTKTTTVTQATTLSNTLPVLQKSVQNFSINPQQHQQQHHHQQQPPQQHHHNHQQQQQQQQQTVVIATSNLGSVQSVMHTPPVTLAGTELSVDRKIETQNRHRFIQNSFDIINPLYIDEKSNVAKRKPPPLVFRSGTREVHNKLEKHRRAHLKECFDILKKQLPASPDEKKTSNLNILHSAIRYIQILRKRERELEHEMERLAREKISWQTKLALLKKDLSSHYEHIDFNKLLAEVVSNKPSNNQVDSDQEQSVSDIKEDEMKNENNGIVPLQSQPVVTQNGVKKVPLPVLASKTQIPVVSSVAASMKEVQQQQQQPVQTALSVLPVGYPINQGLVLQKLAIVPKGITDITPLVPTFITQQQINGKVVPLVNAQYVVGKCPLVVVSTASPRPS